MRRIIVTTGMAEYVMLKGGHVRANLNHIELNSYTRGCTFEDMVFGGYGASSVLFNDANTNTARPNSFRRLMGLAGAIWASTWFVSTSASQIERLLNFPVLSENSGSSTGTGASQTIPHGLMGTPKRVTITPTVTGATVSGLYADGTNIYVTVTSGKTFNWLAAVGI